MNGRGGRCVKEAAHESDSVPDSSGRVGGAPASVRDRSRGGRCERSESALKNDEVVVVVAAKGTESSVGVELEVGSMPGEGVRRLVSRSRGTARSSCRRIFSSLVSLCAPLDSSSSITGWWHMMGGRVSLGCARAEQCKMYLVAVLLRLLVGRDVVAVVRVDDGSTVE